LLPVKTGRGNRGSRSHIFIMYDSIVNDDKPLRILVYSDDRNTRATVLDALGPTPHPDLPRFEYTECATEPAVIARLDDGDVDLAILDGEATPTGGMGIARQIKDEIFNGPPVIVLIGRAQDAWLATWSRAEAAVAHPIDSFRLAEVVFDVLSTSRQPS